MYARPLFVVVGISRAFSSEVGLGSRQENASDQKSEPVLTRFGSSAPLFWACALASPEVIGYMLAA
jgi:hypothetical protein